MAKDGCALLCKYILIFFNVIFGVVGFAFFVIGMWLRFNSGTRGMFESGDLKSGPFVMAVGVLIGLGVVLLIMVAFGLYGTCKENPYALQVFSFLLAILAIAEFVIGGLAYSSRDQVGKSSVEFYDEMYAAYLKNEDPVIGATLTFIHKTLHCCGMTGVPVIEVAKQTCPKPDGFIEHLIMPSCPGLIENYVENKAPLALGILIAIGILQIIALICSIIFARKLNFGCGWTQIVSRAPYL